MVRRVATMGCPVGFSASDPASLPRPPYHRDGSSAAALLKRTGYCETRGPRPSRT